MIDILLTIFILHLSIIFKYLLEKEKIIIINKKETIFNQILVLEYTYIFDYVPRVQIKVDKY